MKKTVFLLFAAILGITLSFQSCSQNPTEKAKN
jgi:hypothetical protein